MSEDGLPIAAWVMDDDDGTTEGDPGALDRPIAYWPTVAGGAGEAGEQQR